MTVENSKVPWVKIFLAGILVIAGICVALFSVLEMFTRQYEAMAVSGSYANHAQAGYMVVRFFAGLIVVASGIYLFTRNKWASWAIAFLISLIMGVLVLIYLTTYILYAYLLVVFPLMLFYNIRFHFKD